MAQVIFQNPEALLLIPAGWLLLLLFAWRRRFKPFGAFLLRLLIIVLVALALAHPALPPEETIPIEPQARLTILVDQSDSLTEAGKQLLRDEAARLARPGTDARILYFSEQPLLLPDPSTAAGQILDPAVSNLAAALTAAGQLVAADNRAGRILLLSDGVPTTGETEDVIAQLSRQNIPVDVVLPGSDFGNEIRVVNLSVPPVLREGETFDIEVTIHARTPAGVALTLSQNRESIAGDVIQLDAGMNLFSFPQTAAGVGLHTFNAAISIDSGSDNHLQNNSYAAFAQVYPPPEILIVANELVQGSRFAALLREAGFKAQVTRPSNVPTRLSALEPYAGMVFIDVPASEMELEQMIAVQEFVRSLGRGLLVTGGRNSFSLGRYDDTPLAELLPLSLEPPPREERPPVALLLLIDHSGSMLEFRRSKVSRLLMAKEAAIRATDILGPDDLIGVLVFDNRYTWIVPFQQVNDGAELLEIQQRIARIPTGGGTRILQALETGISALMEQDAAKSRLAVLLTDGKSFDVGRTIVDYDRLVDEAVAENITLSTIAIGGGADEALLTHLAERGQGRYHFAETPEELPALTISESDILRSDALQAGDFTATRLAPHPIIRGLFLPLSEANPDSAPNLENYLAMTPKPQAEVALQIGPGDPLLSVWGYGLGRVAAWSSDTGAEWATAWRQWPAASRFWGQVVGYTLPAPNLPLGLQQDTIAESNNTVTLVADSVTRDGEPVDLTPTGAGLLTPGGADQQFPLRQVSPGRYERLVRLPEDGAYHFTVNQADKSAETGFVFPYPAEYALPPAGTGSPLLQQIATATGGKIYTLGELKLASGADCSAHPENCPSTEAQPEIELWPWLLGIALGLWPIEIAWRRWGRLRIQ